MPLSFGSLFAGIGGFDLGFELAGMECKWQVEIDDYATRVLEKHWPNVHRERDIRQCGRHNLEPVDVICGGFPCQDISYAGRGAGLDGERSGLFFEAVRLVRELQPRIVVLENVAALLTRGLDRVLGTLAEIGFDAEWHCIPAAAVGAPHIRDRVFVLAYAECLRIQQRGPGSENSGGGRQLRGSCCDDGREEVGCESVLADANGCFVEGFWADRQQVKQPRQKEREPKGRRHRAGECWAIEPDVGRVAHGVPSRVDRLKGLGNAVVPQVAELIGQMILEHERD